MPLKLTPFLAGCFLAPIKDFLGSACAIASVGDILKACSTLGPSPDSSETVIELVPYLTFNPLFISGFFLLI